MFCTFNGHLSNLNHTELYGQGPLGALGHQNVSMYIFMFFKAEALIF